MATVFWDADDVIYIKFLKPGIAIKSAYYTATLKILKQLRKLWENKKNILLQHDNASLGPHKPPWRQLRS
jgi:hypothetical protein